MAVHYAAEDLRLVGLDAGRRAERRRGGGRAAAPGRGEVAAGLGAAGARRPPGYIRGEIRRGQRHALGHSVHHHSDSLSV